MRKLSYSVLALASVYLLLRWDYHVSMIIFNNICSDPTRFGLHVYERVELDNTMIVSIPEDHAEDSMLTHLYLDQDVMVDLSKLETAYRLIWDHSEVLSRIGPVTKLEARIDRLSDGKTLSRAVLIRNKMGWLSNLLTTGYQTQMCPDFQTRDGLRIPEPVRHQMNLIRKTFYTLQ